MFCGKRCQFVFECILYTLIGGSSFVATAEYDGSAKWWAGLIGAVGVVLKAKLSPEKVESNNNEEI